MAGKVGLQDTEFDPDIHGEVDFDFFDHDPTEKDITSRKSKQLVESLPEVNEKYAKSTTTASVLTNVNNPTHITLKKFTGMNGDLDVTLRHIKNSSSSTSSESLDMPMPVDVLENNLLKLRLTLHEANIKNINKAIVPLDSGCEKVKSSRNYPFNDSLSSSDKDNIKSETESVKSVISLSEDLDNYSLPQENKTNHNACDSNDRNKSLVDYIQEACSSSVIKNDNKDIYDCDSFEDETPAGDSSVEEEYEKFLAAYKIKKSQKVGLPVEQHNTGTSSHLSTVFGVPSIANNTKPRTGKPRPGSHRKNMSFTNDEVRRIDRDNQFLLKRILEQQKPRVKSKPSISTRATPLHLSRVTQTLQQKKIKRENLLLLKKIQKVKPSREVSSAFGTGKEPSTSHSRPESVLSQRSSTLRDAGRKSSTCSDSERNSKLEQKN